MQLKNRQLSVEIKINGNTMVRELIKVNEDCHCVTGLVKDRGGHLVNQPCLSPFEKC